MTKRLFIGNLSFDITEDQLREAFDRFGVTQVTIPTRWSRSSQKADRPKGFGFVELPEQQAAAAISAMQGKELGGRAIEISEAQPRPTVQRYGEGGYERRGYGGGGWGGRREGGYGGRH